MFNSPLHYCAVCKQYVELDQTAQECAVQHDCNVQSCPYAHLFAPPKATEDDKSAVEAPAPKPR